METWNRLRVMRCFSEYETAVSSWERGARARNERVPRTGALEPQAGGGARAPSYLSCGFLRLKLITESRANVRAVAHRQDLIAFDFCV